VGAALLGVPLGAYASSRDPMALPGAGLGAVAMLIAVHLLWGRTRFLHHRHAHR
jgi:uncharacterized membrane protein YfcA